MQEFGIDISAYQRGLDLMQATKEGVRFFVLRGAYSAPEVIKGGGRDTAFPDLYEKASGFPFPIGVYQYGTARNPQEAVAEAKYLEETVLAGRKFDLPVYYDMEDERMISVGRDRLTEVAKAWCDYLEKRGFWVGIYASRYFFENYLNDGELKRYSHWVAEWTDALTYRGDPGVCGMWQFGGSINLQRSNIIAGQVVDQNYLLIDYPSQIRKLGLNGFEKSQNSFLPSRNYFQLGDEGEKVRRINDFWYNVFPAYGDALGRDPKNVLGPQFGPNTQAWTAEFQRRTGLVPDGFIGPLTLGKMKEYGFEY